MIFLYIEEIFFVKLDILAMDLFLSLDHHKRYVSIILILTFTLSVNIPSQISQSAYLLIVLKNIVYQRTKYIIHVSTYLHRFRFWNAKSYGVFFKEYESNLYEIRFSATPESYSIYLPIVQRMIDSFKPS